MPDYSQCALYVCDICVTNYFDMELLEFKITNQAFYKIFFMLTVTTHVEAIRCELADHYFHNHYERFGTRDCHQK